MLTAKTAVLVHLQTVGVVFLVFHCIVVALFAFVASQGNFNPHVLGTSLVIIRTRRILPPCLFIFKSGHKKITLFYTGRITLS